MSGLSMRRKPHTKSRRGCHQCKQRHRKCNESYPQCASCIRLNISCTWPSSHPDGSPQSSVPEKHVSKQSEHGQFSSPDLLNSSSATLSLDELRLLHHWMAEASFYHVSTPNPRSRFWSVNVVEVGFDHPFLLHAILAMSAVHKTTKVTQADRPTLLAQADAHMSSCLATYKENLLHPTLELSLPMFLLSSILVTYNLASAQVQEPDDPIKSMVHCFRLLRGVRLVIDPYWEELAKMPTFAHIISGVISSELDPAVKHGQGAEIMALKSLAARLDPLDSEACIRAIESLHDVYLRVEHCGIPESKHGICMIWPTDLSERFLDMVESGDPVATVILAHYTVPLAHSQAAWWLQNWSGRILVNSMRILEPTPELWKWLNWPRDQVELLKKGPMAE